VRRVFLLSPASASGLRAKIVLRPQAAFDLAIRLRSRRGAAIGEVFSFLSGLYFRGKRAYAERYADEAFVITPDRGLLALDAFVTRDDLLAFAAVDIDERDPRYRAPLERDVRALARRRLEAVLLGSIASGKYVSVLQAAFGERLLFPADFVGRGDMSRGGLMLRSVDDGRELRYVPVAGAELHGARPPKLTPRRRR
jgi:hypothetical protein